MMTDPLADMLTRIRNANRIERPAVDMPANKIKVAVAQVLKDEGFILEYQVGRPGVGEDGAPPFNAAQDLGSPKPILRISPKTGPEGEGVAGRSRGATGPAARPTSTPRAISPA